MNISLTEQELHLIAQSVADEVMKRLSVPQGKYIRTRNIPEEYGVSRSYAEQLLKDMRDSGRYEDSFIRDERVVLVSREGLERFWRERGRKHEKDSIDTFVVGTYSNTCKGGGASR